MKKSALRRKKPMKRCRLRADGKPRERFEGLRNEEFRVFVRARPCVVASPSCVYADHQSDAAHVDSKARGSGDAGNLVSLCRRHHQEQHLYGIKSFQRVHQVNFPQLAGALWLAFERERGKAL